MNGLTALVMAYCSIYTGEKAQHCRHEMYKCVKNKVVINLLKTNSDGDEASEMIKSCRHNPNVVVNEFVCEYIATSHGFRHLGYKDEDAADECAKDKGLDKGLE